MLHIRDIYQIVNLFRVFTIIERKQWNSSFTDYCSSFFIQFSKDLKALFLKVFLTLWLVGRK